MTFRTRLAEVVVAWVTWITSGDCPRGAPPVTLVAMSTVTAMARGLGWSSVAIGALQVIGGSRTEAGMRHVDATVDSHVRFMGPMFIGYGLGWLDAASRRDLSRMRVLAGLMALGGASRLVTRATLGRPHRFHDVLMSLELATPVALELAHRSR